MKEKSVDLTLLRRLVGELEAAVKSAEEFKTSIKEDKATYIVEMSKAAGICAALMQESGLLIGDLQSLTMSAQNATALPKSLDLDSLLGPLKGSGSNKN